MPLICVRHACQPIPKSQRLPQDWNARPVKKLVGDNFSRFVRDKSKHVLVFYCEWMCNACQH